MAGILGTKQWVRIQLGNVPPGVTEEQMRAQIVMGCSTNDNIINVTSQSMVTCDPDVIAAVVSAVQRANNPKLT